FRVAQLAEAHDFAGRLLDPVASGDAEVEHAIGHVARDLLGPQDAHLVDAGILDRGPIGDLRRAVHGQVGRLEQLEGGLLQRALGNDELEHQPAPFGIWRKRSTISSAVAAASRPLLAAPGADRSRACSTFSVVSTPKMTGIPVSSCTRAMPDAHSPATNS